MITDIYANTIMQEGGQIDPAFLNNGTRFGRSMMTDQLLQQLIGAVSNAATRPDCGGDDGADVSTLWAYAMHPGRAFLRQGSANNKIQISPGTLFQKIANADGQDSTLIPFTFDGSSAGEFTLSNGDATNPRVDLLQMALSYTSDTPASVDFQDAVTRANTTVAGTLTRRRVQCTLSVKQGTPAASPTIPDPDAGCVPVGSVVVGHGWTTGGSAPIFGFDGIDTNNLIVHDQRMPIGVTTLRIDPVLYKLETAWALGGTNQKITASSGVNSAFWFCPQHCGRVIGMDLEIDTTLVIGAVTLGFYTVGNTGSAAYKQRNTFNPSTTIVNGFRATRVDIDGNHNTNSGISPQINPSAVNKIGVPIWTSGLRVPQRPVTGNLGWLAIRVTNQTNGTGIMETGLYIAGL